MSLHLRFANLMEKALGLNILFETNNQKVLYFRAQFLPRNRQTEMNQLESMFNRAKQSRKRTLLLNVNQFVSLFVRPAILRDDFFSINTSAFWL